MVRISVIGAMSSTFLCCRPVTALDSKFSALPLPVAQLPNRRIALWVRGSQLSLRLPLTRHARRGYAPAAGPSQKAAEGTMPVANKHL